MFGGGKQLWANPIQRAEPAPSLFQVPDDYTIKDQPTNNFVYREMKKE